MQYKIWFIKVDGQKEGPYSVQELKKHPYMTPDTLVWKEGFKEWLPARYVPELKAVFEDEDEEEEETPLHERFKLKTVQNKDSTLAIERSNFPFFFYWLIILLFILAYFLYRWNNF
jgi:hypothetical protein